MKTTIWITMLVMTSVVGLTINGIATSERTDRTEWGERDFSGTYVSVPLKSRCNTLVTSGDTESTRAVHITHSRGYLTLRANTTRVLHIERRAQRAPQSLHYGLARWVGDDLVVESLMPAVPLWTEYRPQRPQTVLVERFSLQDATFLIYEAAYKAHGQPLNEIEIALVKCRPQLSRTGGSLRAIPGASSDD
jgi:hypothetical protein